MSRGGMSTATLVVASSLIGGFMMGFLPGVVLVLVTALFVAALWLAVP